MMLQIHSICLETIQGGQTYSHIRITKERWKIHHKALEWIHQHKRMGDTKYIHRCLAIGKLNTEAIIFCQHNHFLECIILTENLFMKTQRELGLEPFICGRWIGNLELLSKHQHV